MSASASGDLIYLDYNATTPVAPEVLEVISVALKDHWANPSSGHDDGRELKLGNSYSLHAINVL